MLTTVANSIKMDQKLLALRKTLHRHPELSGAEKHTAQRIFEYLKEHAPTLIITGLGGHGLAAVYAFQNPGKTVVIRCELDALPIHEQNEFPHRSTVEGVAHKCGHDGHMTIVAGLAPWIKAQQFKAGKIVLLFQPSEENGQGAQQVLQDARFSALKPDYVFAPHNIPQAPLNDVIVIDQAFSAEVQSCKIRLQGVEAHAAEPEKGVNPALAMAEIITALATFNLADPMSEHFTVVTPVHLQMGQKAYGISAGQGELHYTVRTWGSEQMNTLQSKIEATISEIATAHRLGHSMDWFEHFPASPNAIDGVRIIRAAAKTNGFTISERPYPFKFGEDFGWFSKQYKTAMFGLGAGTDTPDLHHPAYDFPDALIETGLAMFQSIISSILK